MDEHEIELVVSNNGGPRYTLTEKSGRGSSFAKELEGALWMNHDRAEFYRAVAQHIMKRIGEGWSVTYRDVEA